MSCAASLRGQPEEEDVSVNIPATNGIKDTFEGARAAFRPGWEKFGITADI
jgi:hypothetical protein